MSSRAQTYETQLDACVRASSARGDHIATIYEEKISTRVKTNLRPELTRLRLDAQAGKVSKLYVFKLDRLTRSGIRDTFALVEELRGHGVEIANVADGFDISGPGPTTDLIMAMFAWAAQMERLATSERISAARLRVEAAGGRWGPPVTRLTRDVRARILELRAEGRSVRAIAVALKIPRATVGRAAKEGAASS